MNHSDAASFLTAFRDRQRCFADLLALSREQPVLIADEDFSRLMSLLGQKQRLLGQLEIWQTTFPQLLDRWRRQRELLPNAVRQACEQVLADADRTLKELLALEQHCSTELAGRRDAAKLELAELNTGRHVQTVYRDHLAPSTSRYLDLGG